MQAVRERAARYAVRSQIDLDLGSEEEIRTAIDRALRELREVFHRRGRLSSRSEALDEVSKLLFAHVLSLASEGRGLTTDSVLGNRTAESSPAQLLKEFVRGVFARHLPQALAHEIPLVEFDLRIKAQENELAREILLCFDDLSKQRGIVGAEGIEVVDILNEVFGKFLSDSFVDEKQLGQYLTPTEVVRFMVQLAISELEPSDVALLTSPSRCNEFGFVLDPSCGVGSFLAEFVRGLHSRMHQHVPAEDADMWLHRMLNDVVVGVDKSERMIRYALTNMAMFGLPAAHLRLGNALARGQQDTNHLSELDGRVGLILTNPPFGAEFEAKDSREYQIGRELSQGSKLTSEILFLERYVDWLRPGGHLVAIVPDSVLTNRGAFQELRNQLRKNVEVRGVFSLPSETFAASGTSTKTSVLHLRKHFAGVRSEGRCFVAVCRDIGYTIATRGTQRVKTSTGRGDLPVILDQVRQARSTESGDCLVASLENEPRWDAGFHASIGPALANRLNSGSSEVIRVRDVAVLSRDRTNPTRGLGTFKYIEISDVDSVSCICYPKSVDRSEAPSRARKVVRSGDVVVSTVRPDRRITGVVTKGQDGAVCTTGFAVLRPHSIDSLVLARLLKTDEATVQILRHNIGIAYPAIDEECLLDVILPIHRGDLLKLADSASKVLALEGEVYQARIAFSASVTAVSNEWRLSPDRD